jgi:hypothetical protein
MGRSRQGWGLLLGKSQLLCVPLFPATCRLQTNNARSYYCLQNIRDLPSCWTPKSHWQQSGCFSELLIPPSIGTRCLGMQRRRKRTLHHTRRTAPKSPIMQDASSSSCFLDQKNYRHVSLVGFYFTSPIFQGYSGINYLVKFRCFFLRACAKSNSLSLFSRRWQ